MIAFDIVCGNDHTFEAWFRDSREFDRLRKRKAVDCPVCGDTAVEKALMAPNISTSKRQMVNQKKEVTKEVMKVLSHMRKEVEKNCDYVGKEFAVEARKIHYGDAEERGIYGEATPEEASDLTDEGVEIGVVPWLPAAEN